jgi:hypothetical protein
MQMPFPALTHLELEWEPSTSPSRGSRAFPIPWSLLGGSAPRLQHLRLENISLPQLPTFLLSARNLATLELNEISHDDVVSHEALVKSLAVLNTLTVLSITFLDDPSDDQSPPDPTKGRPDLPRRTILPALTDFHYRGYSEYLEDILPQIDTPQLDNSRIEYFVHLIQAPQLSHFIDRTEGLNLRQFTRAEVTFYPLALSVDLDYSQGEYHQAQLSLEILEQPGLDIQVECVADMLGQLVAMFPNVDQLSVHGDNVDPTSMESAEWLPFFRLFHAVEALHLSGGVTAYIVSALEDIGEGMVTEVFPALRLIWLDEDKECDLTPEPVGSIERFLSLRQLSGLPVTVVHTEDEFFEVRDDSDRESDGVPLVSLSSHII